MYPYQNVGPQEFDLSSGLAIPCNVVMLTNDPDGLVIWIGDGWNKYIPGLKRNR